jgi:hypothetical protein
LRLSFRTLRHIRRSPLTLNKLALQIPAQRFEYPSKLGPTPGARSAPGTILVAVSRRRLLRKPRLRHKHLVLFDYLWVYPFATRRQQSRVVAQASGRSCKLNAPLISRATNLHEARAFPAQNTLNANAKSSLPAWHRHRSLGAPVIENRRPRPRAHPTRRRRAPPAHRYVLRLGGVDRALRQASSIYERSSVPWRIGGFIARYIGDGVLLFRVSACTET